MRTETETKTVYVSDDGKKKSYWDKHWLVEAHWD